MQASEPEGVKGSHSQVLTLLPGLLHQARWELDRGDGCSAVVHAVGHQRHAVVVHGHQARGVLDVLRADPHLHRDQRSIETTPSRFCVGAARQERVRQELSMLKMRVISSVNKSVVSPKKIPEGNLVSATRRSMGVGF